jgi:lysophospholipase L1-like esterase
LLLAGIVSTVAFLLSCVAGEMALRYRERHRGTVPGTAPLLYYRHSRLGLALVRDYDYFGWYHTNRQGFRGTRPVSIEKTPGVLRILAVGGSTTFDVAVSSDSAAWPARLEHWVQQLYPGRKFEVINAGVPGYVAMQDLIRLETELGRYQPDLLILYQGHNDLFAGLRRSSTQIKEPFDPAPGEIPRLTPWMGWLERHSLLYTKIATGIQRLRLSRSAPRDAGARKPEEESDDGSQQFATTVALYLAVAGALNIPVVVPEIVQISGTGLEASDPVARQIWRISVPFASPDRVLRAYQRYDVALQKVCEQYHVPFLPMHDLGIAGARFYAPNDPIHFNDQGADRFAEGLARKILQENLLQNLARSP